MRTSSSSQSTGGTSITEHGRDVEIDLGPIGPPRLHRSASRFDLRRLDRLRLLQLHAHVLAVLVGARRERRAMRLGGLVEEERPGVRRRLGNRRLDDVRTELLQPLDIRLGRHG